VGKGVAGGRIRNAEVIAQLEALRERKTTGFSFERKTWKILGDDFYTCVFPADMAIDPAALRLIHSFDPGAIPIVRKQLWKDPQGREVLVSHWGIARYIKNPKKAALLGYVEMPRDAKHPRPNVLEWIHEMSDPRKDGPAGFLPFDGWLAAYLHANYRETTDVVRELQDRLIKSKQRREDERQKHYDEMAYRDWHMNKQITPWLEKLGVADWAATYRNKRAPKPMVFLGR
jgi:hypothetical protein